MSIDPRFSSPLLDTDGERNLLLAAALMHASLGRPVLPVHSVRPGPAALCTCGRAVCESVGKHPRNRGGLSDATTDHATIRDWWKQWPDANVGVVMGAGAGCWALDVDLKGDGPGVLNELVQEHGALPTTAKTVTGSGGFQYWFRHPGDDVRIPPRVRIFPGIDVRGDGSYVVVPPSVHVSGSEYVWETTSQGFGAATPLADAPAWLLQAVIAGGTVAPQRSSNEGAGERRFFGEGERNDRLFRLACSLRRQELDQGTMLLQMRHANETLCRPPLSDSEVQSIVSSACRYRDHGSAARPIQEPASTTPSEQPDENFTDLGNARRLVRNAGRDIRFLAGARRAGWLSYYEGRWINDRTGHVMRRAKETVRNMFAEASAIDGRAAREELVEHALESESKRALEAMIRLAETEPGVPVTLAELDTDLYALNTLSGTVDLRTGSLRPHRREDLISRQVPVEYDGTADCPRWESFVDEIMLGDRDMVRYLQKAVGYALTGDGREQCLFILYGQGANGKSTFLEVLRRVLGDYAQQASFSSFTLSRNRSAENPRGDLVRLAGVRFVSASESRPGERMDEAVVKQITGGEAMTARRIYEDDITFIPQYKCFLGTNHRPVIDGTDFAVWRRIRLIPFDAQFVGCTEDKDLQAKLLAEAPGILRWAVEGCLQWQNEGLIEPEAVRAATSCYRQDMDPLREFMEECCEPAPSAEELAGDVYTAYVDWANRNGEPVLSMKRVGAALTERGFSPGRNGAGLRIRRGLQLRVS